MGISPVMNPYGGPLILCDKMLGNAYEVVKFVARNVPFIRQVSANMEALVSLANSGSNPAAPASGLALTLANQTYSADTSLDVVAYSLPAIATLTEGAWFEVYDAMNNAARNNITITASGTDQITDHLNTANTHVITNSNTITRYTIRGGVWRVMQYGG